MVEPEVPVVGAPAAEESFADTQPASTERLRIAAAAIRDAGITPGPAIMEPNPYI